MGTALRIVTTFIFNNWKGLLMMAVIGGIIFGVKSCNDTKEENVRLTKDIATERTKRAKADKSRDSIAIVLNRVRSVASLAESKFKKAEEDRKSNLEKIHSFVSSASPKVKRDTLIRLAEKWQIRNLPGTVELLPIKGFPTDSLSYSQQETDKILWTVLDAANLEQDRTTTTKALTNYQAKVEVTTRLVKEAVAREQDRHYFLGIGRKKGMKKLSVEIAEIMQTTL